MKHRRWFILVILMALCSANVFSQGSLLTRRISIRFSQVPLQDALEHVARSGGFRLSYDADIIRGSGNITLQAENRQVGKILTDILGPEIDSKQIGNHIILVPGKKPPAPAAEKSCYFLSGKIIDAATLRPLDHVSVYLIEKHKAYMSDTSGNYRILFQAENRSGAVSYSRNGYQDTVLFVTVMEDKTLNVMLNPLPATIQKVETREVLIEIQRQDTFGLRRYPVAEVEQLRLVRWLVPKKSRETARNLEIYGTRAFQVSFIPYLGTNWMTSGSVSNAVSFNILAGYSRETNGFELGGLVNINRHRMRGFQLAGLGNIVGSNTIGFQVGGLFNIGLGPFRGFQLAGLMNYLPDTLKGMQLAGLCNVTTGKMRGFQLAGLGNIAMHHVNGWQLAGLGNIGMKEANKAQISGLFNYCSENWGLQLSGLINVSKKDNRGAQIAGLLNYTNRLNGFQLGFFNYINTLESGVPIGFFSFIRHGGYYKLEISADEVFYANVAFRSGTPRFYNIYKIGVGESWMMNFTWGLGTRFSFGERFALNLDLTSGVITSTTPVLKYHGMLARLVPALDLRLAPGLALFFGPSANLYWFNTGSTVRPDGIAPYTLYDLTFTTGPHRIQLWVGGTVGFKLF